MSIFRKEEPIPERRIQATRYDAAQTTSDNAKHWAMTDDYSADASLSPDVRRTLRNRSRYESENNSYAKGLILVLTGDCIGTGPRLQIQSDDRDYNTSIEQSFYEWSQEIDLPGKLYTMRQTKIRDGEVFAVLFTNPTLRSDVKLDVMLVEADRVTCPYLDSDPRYKRNVDGIQFNEYGLPISYSVLKYHPGDYFGGTERFAEEGGKTASSGLVGEYMNVPASNMVHWFRVDRPEQHRGLPELTPALPLFAQLRRFTLAVIASAEVAADFAAFIYTDSPPADDEEVASCTPYDHIPIAKRTATVLPDTWKVSQLKPEQPCSTYSDFKREILGEIGRCLMLPINIITGDSSRHNYASGRLDHQVYQKSILIEQDHCVRNVLSPLFRRWFNEYSLCTSIKNDEIPQARWFWDGFLHVDPTKESKAQELRLKNCLTNLAAEYAKVGKDWEVELEQIAREQSLCNEFGLTHPSTPKPTGLGTFPDSDNNNNNETEEDDKENQ